jgi:glutamate carboxypeptidase
VAARCARHRAMAARRLRAMTPDAAAGLGGGSAATLVGEAELAALSATLEAELPAYLRDLERLVSIDCGSYTKAGVDEVATWVAAALEGLGATVRREANESLGDTVVGMLDGRAGGPRILLIGHMDTVFPVGTAAQRPFRIDGGIARGPGVTDMKSGLLTGLSAVRAVRAISDGGEPFGRVTFVANPDEEIGSPASTPIIRALAAEADVCLVLECARANGDIVSARKGTVDARLDFVGRAAHAGVEPEKGRNAIHAAADAAVRLQALNGRWPGVTANVGVMSGGTRPNVVPDHASLEVDVRSVTRDALEAAWAAVEEIARTPVVPDVTVAIEQMGRHWPMEKLERSGRLVDLAVELAGRLGFQLRDAATGGASDANTTAGMGIPTLDGLGPIGGLDHSPEEYLEVASIVPRTTLLAALLLAVSRDPVVAAWRSGPAGGGPGLSPTRAPGRPR